MRSQVQLLEQEAHERSAAADELDNALAAAQERLAEAEQNESALLDYVQVHFIHQHGFHLGVRFVGQIGGWGRQGSQKC